MNDLAVKGLTVPVFMAYQCQRRCPDNIESGRVCGLLPGYHDNKHSPHPDIYQRHVVRSRVLLCTRQTTVTMVTASFKSNQTTQIFFCTDHGDHFFKFKIIINTLLALSGSFEYLCCVCTIITNTLIIILSVRGRLYTSESDVR